MTIPVAAAALASLVGGAALFAEDIQQGGAIVACVSGALAVVGAYLTARENRLALQTKLAFDAESLQMKATLTTVQAKQATCEGENQQLRNKDDQQQRELDESQRERAGMRQEIADLRAELASHVRVCPGHRGE